MARADEVAAVISLVPPPRPSLRPNKHCTVSLFKTQTPGHSNLWVLIQNFQECLLYFQHCIAPRNLSLKCIPHDTTTVNQQREIVRGYLQMGNCKIKRNRWASGVLLLTCRAPFRAETSSQQPPPLAPVLEGYCLSSANSNLDLQESYAQSQGPKLLDLQVGHNLVLLSKW